MQTASNDIKRHGFVLGATRFVGVVGGLVVVGTAVGASTAERITAIGRPGPADLADALTALAGLAALVLVVGLLGSVLLSVLATVPGSVGRAARRLDAQLTPRTLRQVSGILLGATLGTAVLPSTGLADGRPRPVAAQPIGDARAAATAPDPFAPTRPVVRPLIAPDLLAGSRLAEPEGIVVHRGDTLWEIVGRALGPEATDVRIAAEWPRWYAHNRAVIGADPDLILPGQVLMPPEATDSAGAPDPFAPSGGR